MTGIWGAIALLVLAWDAANPHLAAPSSRLAVIAGGASALLLVRRRASFPAFSNVRWLLACAAGAAIAALLLPSPVRVAPALLAIGAALAIATPLRRGLAGNIASIPWDAGVVLGAVAIADPLVAAFQSNVHDLDFFAPLVAAILRACGVLAAADPPFLHVAGTGNVFTVDCTTEKLFGHAWSIFVLAGAAFVLLSGRFARRWRTIATLAVAAVVFALVRFSVLVAAMDAAPHPEFFFERAWVFGSLVPLVLILSWIAVPRAPDAGAGTRRAPSSELRTRDLALAAALGASIAAALGFHDPGRPRPTTPTRVLVDEHHSNWEWSTIQLTKESYGVQTVYNYSELVRYLRSFYEVRPNFAPLTTALLDSADVVVLKTPTRPYAAEEVDALVRFVEDGGGLWLVGDHTNIFGMGTHLNQVASRFGFRFRYDALIDLRTHGRQLFRRPRLFTHPSIRHLPPLLFATSCGMEGGASTDAVIRGRSLLADHQDFSVNSFFGDFRPDPSESFGSMLQSIAVHRGRGRVLGFSDSTIFSNFFMFVRGKPELALGSVAWVARENRAAWVRPLLAGAAALIGVVFLLRARRLPAPAVALMLAAGAAPTFAIVARGLDSWVAGWSQLPAPREPLPIVAFDRGITDYDVPDIAEIADYSSRGFHTFTVWTQRTGLVPATRLLGRCFDDSRAIVLIHPRELPSPDEMRRFESYVRDGGRLLVLESPHDPADVANQILAPFGLRFENAETESALVRVPAVSDSSFWLRHLGSVVGGKPHVVLPDSTSALSSVEHGAGRVAAFAGSPNFNDESLGTTSEVPDANRLAIYRLEFHIFEDILGLRQEAEITDTRPAESASSPSAPSGRIARTRP